MRTAEVLVASIFVLFGGLVLLDAARLGFGWGTDGPQSGFFPFWLALLMVLASAVIIFQEARRASPKSFVDREKLAPVLQVLGPAAGAVLLMHWIGFYLSSALYLGFYMRWVGRHSWSAIILLSIGIPLATFLVFEKWFLVPMPKGPVEAWLGY